MKNIEFEKKLFTGIQEEEWKKEQLYLKELPKEEPIKIFQLRQLFHPGVYVYIKPRNHKIYWEGEAIYIPSSFYNCNVNDISLRKSYDEELCNHGSIGIFIDKIDVWEEIADKRELEKINEYYELNEEF